MQLAGYLFLIALICGALAPPVVFAVKQARSGRGADDSGDGGSVVPGAPSPADGPAGPGDPPWWPQFERDLADYANARGPGSTRPAGRRSAA